jgi:hypothetical protein
LSLAGHSRMLDVIKFAKVAKSYPEFMDSSIMTANCLELQFSKVKALTEKKLDYARFVSYLANLGAIKILNIDPVHVNGLMHDTPFTGVVQGLAAGANKVGTANGDKRRKGKGLLEDKDKDKQKGNSANNRDDVNNIVEDGEGTSSSEPALVAEIKRKIDSYKVGRLRGKAALVVKFLLVYLDHNHDAHRIFQNLRDKSAWTLAQGLLLKSVRRIQHFVLGRITRLRYVMARTVRTAASVHKRRYLGATKFQALYRSFRARQRTVIPLAQQIYSKYHVDDVDGAEKTDDNNFTRNKQVQNYFYWFNSRTQCAFWIKPRFLGDVDCGFPITVPSLDEQFLITCCYCEQANATKFCDDCNDMYCAACYVKFHKSGHRKDHVHLPLIACIECEFQAGVRYCVTCKDCFCDSCFTVHHGKGRKRLHIYKWCHEVCQDCGSRAAQWRRTDSFTGIGADLCVVCYKDRYEGIDPKSAPFTERVRFIGRIVREYRHEQAVKKRESEKLASALKHATAAEDKRRSLAAGRIQRVWRGRRAFRLMKPFLLERKEFLLLREHEMPTRLGIWYWIRQALCIPMHLRSDTTIEKVHKLYPGYMRNILAACIENDWALACQLLEEHELGLKEGQLKVRMCVARRAGYYY